jgi:hypothetical protein
MRTRRRWAWWLWSIAVVMAIVVAGCGSRVPVAKPPTTLATTVTTVPAPATSTVASVTSASSTATPTAAPSTTAPFDQAAATAQITANWEKFFTPGTSVGERVALLQNGPALRAAIEQSAANPLQQQASAKVTKVTFTSPTEATVNYDVYLNGAVALPNAEGMAVLDGGTWKVAQASFCSLVSLGASGPLPGCS